MDLRIQERATALFSALAHPTRLRIVELLLHEGRTVNEIATSVGASQSGTSQHLAILSRAGVLIVQQRGSTRTYRVRGPRIEAILRLIEEFCRVHALYGPGEDEDEDAQTAPASSDAGADRTAGRDRTAAGMGGQD